MKKLEDLTWKFICVKLLWSWMAISAGVYLGFATFWIVRLYMGLPAMELTLLNIFYLLISSMYLGLLLSVTIILIMILFALLRK